MPKPPKKIVTEDKFIDRAQVALNIKYPQVIRKKLIGRNGFSWGFFERFYCVKDDDDIFHTNDDVVRENTNKVAGWQQYIPEGFVTIADDGGGAALLLNTNKDGKVYYYQDGDGEVFAETEDQLIEKLAQQEELKEIYKD